jgi:hypothetical protein
MTMLNARSPRVFSICPHANGMWSARRGDGLVGGIFVDHDAALRFAERESLGEAAFIIDDAQRSHSAQLSLIAAK